MFFSALFCLPLQFGAMGGKDTLAAGVPWLFSPVLGLGTNPLWPRLYETFGEHKPSDPSIAESTRQRFRFLQCHCERFPDRKSLAVTVIFVIRLHVTVEFSQSFQAKLLGQ